MDIQDYIKKGLDAYYDRYHQVTEEGFCRWMRPDVPDEMKAADGDDEWSIWRLVPSIVTKDDIRALENEFGLVFPEWYKVFISTYHHYFDVVPEQGLDEPLHSIKDMYNPLLCRLGYLPFTWDSEYGNILCIDLNEGSDEEHGAIYEIDHDILFGYDEEHTERNTLKESLTFLYPNFKAYFDHTFLVS
ncbi:SMI1/KNR4 family protein [Paenibacillus selenitireducens]|uniref:SMI1/KNR4 family protein n=1 Tax=Paenibacillus selenitireducens TaxID=1324314 RepID=A0A1T2X146_9BACL|nr:SMI1/KNR4 family protein [Paenibacillus selenitireducens]OPA73572.1 SMI1/KNR4 family protein [Paenibacillus selenitireducens]